MERRNIILGLAGTGVLAGGAGLAYLYTNSGVSSKDEGFEISLSAAEWKERLTESEFAVLREGETEKPFTSPLNEEKRKGTFLCGGCQLENYRSEDKFKSGTGWPSFTKSIPDSVRTKADYALLVPRTEVHCRRCGGHLGHIFDDGPEPTGKRHCLNGLALDFRPAEA